jgi:hypothetical protein
MIWGPVPESCYESPKHKHKVVGRVLLWGLLGLTAVQYSLSNILGVEGWQRSWQEEGYGRDERMWKVKGNAAFGPLETSREGGRAGSGLETRWMWWMS